MEIGSVFLIVALLLLVGLFVGRPFMEEKPVKSSAVNLQEHERSALLAERDRLVTALKELEFDNLLHKIPEEDYPNQRARLLEQGAEVLRKLDDLQSNDDAGILVEVQTEAMISQKLDLNSGANAKNGKAHTTPGNGAGVVAAVDDDLEVLLSDRRRLRKEKSAGFCPKCGRPLQKSDYFCPKCGARIQTS